MSTAAVGSQVIFNFAWQGPTQYSGGLENDGLSADSVCLAIEGVKTEISIELPQNITPTEVHELSFTCRRSDEATGQIKITHPKSLTATPEQMRQLMVKVSVLAKADSIDRSTQFYEDVPLEMPEAFEIGKTYQLRVISEKFVFFSAHLIRDYTRDVPASLPSLPPPVVDAQLIADQKELSESLESALAPLMMRTISKLSSLSLLSALSVKGSNQVSGLTIIENEIQAIERIQFDQLIAKIRQIKSTPSIFGWEKKVLKESISVIGTQGLVNIMHAKLESILNGQIPAHLESTVNQLCEEFKRNCALQAWS